MCIARAGFLDLRVDFGTASVVSDDEAGAEPDAADDSVAVVGSFRRELKDEMKSTAWGESPSRLLKWEAASGLEREAA